MKIHIFTSENFYTSSFLRFLGKNFDLSSSLIVFRKKAAGSFNYGPALSERIVYSGSNADFFFRFYPALRRSEEIYLHQLPYGPSLLLWSIFTGLLSKTTWIIWGGDVYIYRQGKASLSTRFYELLRRRVIKRIPRIASFIPGDFEVAKKIYEVKASYYQCKYPLPFDLLNFKERAPGDSETGITKILIGNSGDPSNRHLEILSKISPLREAEIRIYCPVSYSGSPDYIKSVTEKGKEIFGDIFVPLPDILEPEEYLNFLAGMDVAVMNHERQQGLGNIIPLLFFGKKVYMQSGTTSFDYLRSIGCKLYEIPDDAFNESFLDIDSKELVSNRVIIREMLSENSYIELWEKIINCS